MKVAFLGPSGSGKSTAAGFCEQAARRRGLTVFRAKLATPLYELQNHFYRIAGRPIPPGAQDQVLLEAAAQHLRRLSPRVLVDDLQRRLAQVNADVVINDDLRDVAVDYPVMAELGFKFVRVSCNEGVRRERLRARGDLSVVVNSATTAGLDEISPNLILENSANDLGALQSAVEHLLDAGQ